MTANNNEHNEFYFQRLQFELSLLRKHCLEKFSEQKIIFGKLLGDLHMNYVTHFTEKQFQSKEPVFFSKSYFHRFSKLTLQKKTFSY